MNVPASVAVRPAALVSATVGQSLPTSAAPAPLQKPDHVVVSAAISTNNRFSLLEGLVESGTLSNQVQIIYIYDMRTVLIAVSQTMSNEIDLF